MTRRPPAFLPAGVRLPAEQLLEVAQGSALTGRPAIELRQLSEATIHQLERRHQRPGDQQRSRRRRTECQFEQPLRFGYLLLDALLLIRFRRGRAGWPTPTVVRVM